jgi:hypothetical protein
MTFFYYLFGKKIEPTAAHRGPFWQITTGMIFPSSGA